MSFIKGITEKVLWKLCRVLLPQKYQNYFFFKEFIRSPYLKKLSLKKTIWCFKKGFLPKEYFQFNLAENNPKDYISCRTNANQLKFNQDFNGLINNKILFEIHMRIVINGIANLSVIENIGYIENGFLYSLCRKIETGNNSSLILFLEKNELILKPIRGSRGNGIILVKKNGDEYLLNEKNMKLEEMVCFFKTLDNYLIQEKFKQHGFSSNIFPGALNTIRLCTMIDPLTNKPFIPYAVHRFCSNESGNTDNLSQGGLAAFIEENGRLGKAVTFSKEGKLLYYDSHPVSNMPINFEQIPNWENVKKSMLEVAEKMPYFRNIGWDIALSDNEIHILEGNLPDIDILQIFKPAKECEPLWNFFKNNNFFD